MEPLAAPLGAARLGVRVLRAGTRAVTFPARVLAGLTFVAYEELLDVAERAALVEPPDPPPSALARREPRRRRRAA